MKRLRTTHTYAIADVSETTYNEIRALLVEAGYQQALHQSTSGEGEGEGEVLDMHGIALRCSATSATSQGFCPCGETHKTHPTRVGAVGWTGHSCRCASCTSP